MLILLGCSELYSEGANKVENLCCGDGFGEVSIDDALVGDNIAAREDVITGQRLCLLLCAWRPRPYFWYAEQ